MRPPSRAPDAAVVGPPPLEVRYVGHATVLLEGAQRRVLTDPFLRDRLGPLERHGPLPDPSDLGELDLVVISHGHPDHFDRASLAALDGAPTIVVPRGLGDAARQAARGEVLEIAAGERVEAHGIGITAVAARHWISPGAPRALPLGYVLDLGSRVYFAGDTARLPVMRELAGSVDVALLPVWTWGPHRGPGHLGPRSAAEALDDIRPAVAIPIHWGTLYPRRLHRVWSRPLTEPGDRFAAYASALAPATTVTVLRPGEGTSIGSTG